MNGATTRVPGAGTVDALPQLGDRPRHLVPGHDRQLRRRLALDDVQVAVAHPAGGDADEHLARPRPRVAQLLDPQRPRRAQYGGSHHVPPDGRGPCEQRRPGPRVQRARDVSLAVRVLDEAHVAGAEPPHLAVGHLDLDAARQGHDEQRFRRVVGHDVGGLLEHATELEVGDRDPVGERDPRRPSREGLLGGLQVDVLEVRLAIVVRPDAHVVGFAVHVAPKCDSSSTGSSASCTSIATDVPQPGQQNSRRTISSTRPSALSSLMAVMGSSRTSVPCLWSSP